MTHSYVWHDSFICVTWLIHMCDVTHSYVWHDSFTYVTYAKWPTWLGRSHPRPWLGPRDTQDWYWEGVKARFVCILAVYILYMCLPPAPIIGATRHPRRYWEGVNARCVCILGVYILHVCIWAWVAAPTAGAARHSKLVLGSCQC